jgi:hypothetical protein
MAVQNRRVGSESILVVERIRNRTKIERAGGELFSSVVELGQFEVAADVEWVEQLYPSDRPRSGEGCRPASRGELSDFRELPPGQAGVRHPSDSPSPTGSTGGRTR